MSRKLSAAQLEEVGYPDARKMAHEILALRAQNAELVAALERLAQWSKAYPLAVFPEPDLKRARELLEAGGMTLDAISASAMRHVIEGVGEQVRAALVAAGHKPT